MLEVNIKVDSCVRADKIYTLSKTIVVKKFGRVKQQVIDKVKEKIAYLLDER